MRISSGVYFTLASSFNRALNEDDRPERWSQLPDTVKDLPGVFSHMLTFFAGAHACIGYRFSIAECVSLISILLAYERLITVALAG